MQDLEKRRPNLYASAHFPNPRCCPSFTRSCISLVLCIFIFQSAGKRLRRKKSDRSTECRVRGGPDRCRSHELDAAANDDLVPPAVRPPRDELPACWTRAEPTATSPPSILCTQQEQQHVAVRSGNTHFRRSHAAARQMRARGDAFTPPLLR